MLDKNLLDSRILVIGGSGFLGARIVRQLRSAGISPHLLLRPNSSLTRIADLIKCCQIHQGDLTDLHSTRQIIGQVRPDILFYTAGSGAYKGQSDRDTTFNSNLVATHHLLIASELAPHCHIIYSGTSLSQGSQNKPLTEFGTADPVSFYGATKTAAVILMRQAAVHQKRPITILIPFAIYGPGEPVTRLIPNAIRAAMEGTTLALTQPGIVRDYVFVDDVADAYLSTAANAQLFGKTINIAGGTAISNERVVQLIETQLGVVIDKRIGGYTQRSTDSKFWCADISKARTLMNWAPRYSLTQGLKLTIDWYRENGFKG